MVSQTNEQALEAAIEKRLTGFCLEEIGPGGPYAEELHAPDVPFGHHHGYRLGYPQDFNPQYAIDETRFWDFLRSTQSKELEKLRRSSANNDEFQRKILERFDRLVKKNGLLHLLKKGLRVDDAHLILMYPAPLASSAERVHENFAANQFSSIRQVRFSLTNPLDEIIRLFNERWFHGWSATLEEKRVKFLNIADGIQTHPDFEEKYKNNPDAQNRELAFDKIFDDVMLRNRRNELELYRLLAGDAAFKASMRESLRRVLEARG